jgi:hypothetical protein
MSGTANWGNSSDLQGPVEIYIGNVNPTTEMEQVVIFLKENAAMNHIADFKVDEIVPLTKVPNPTSRSWKLRVPKRLETYMLSSHCYHQGWQFRKWDFHGPKRRTPTNGQVEMVPRILPRTMVTEAEATMGTSTTTGAVTTEDSVASASMAGATVDGERRNSDGGMGTSEW